MCILVHFKRTQIQRHSRKVMWKEELFPLDIIRLPIDYQDLLTRIKFQEFVVTPLGMQLAKELVSTLIQIYTSADETVRKDINIYYYMCSIRNKELATYFVTVARVFSANQITFDSRE